MIGTDLRKVWRHVKTSGNQGPVRFDLFFNPDNAFFQGLDKKERKVLSGTGAHGRGVMRRSIRKAAKKKKTQQKHRDAGGPPRYYSRGFGSLKDGIFFHYIPVEAAVYIGPSKLKSQVDPVGKASSAKLLEEGGAGRMTVWRHNPSGRGSWRKVRGHWRSFPYVLPARKPSVIKMKQLMATVELK